MQAKAELCAEVLLSGGRRVHQVLVSWMKTLPAGARTWMLPAIGAIALMPAPRLP
jgi:hypothetical protein